MWILKIYFEIPGGKGCYFMSNWMAFENESASFLNQHFSKYPIKFELSGGANSNNPDIDVFMDNEYMFSIEAKLSPAQSGQFVVLINKDTFIYSPQNKYELNKYSKQIIDYLNENKSKYLDVQQNAISIDCNNLILTNWVISYYSKKSCPLFITSTKLDSYKRIIKTTDLSKNFIVEARLRRKKSGSSNLPISERASAGDLITKRYASAKIINNGKKTMTSIPISRPLDKNECYFGDNYFLSHKDNNNYYIKKLSKTNNVNVIFSLTYKGEESTGGINLVKELLFLE